MYNIVTISNQHEASVSIYFSSSLSSVCFCQIGNVSENDINYKDLIEIKGLFYLKADSTLATGRVVRFNRKNEA